MDEIQYLGKDGKIDFGKTKYKAISEEKVTTMVRKSLIKHKLVVFPIEQTSERVGNLTRVNTTYKMVNAEEPSEYIILASGGEGADSQDKGIGKAMTYAYKYMLLRTFGIPTGEDPDKISSDELTERFKEEEKLKIMTRAEKIAKVTALADARGTDIGKVLDRANVDRLEDIDEVKLDALLESWSK